MPHVGIKEDFMVRCLSQVNMQVYICIFLKLLPPMKCTNNNIIQIFLMFLLTKAQIMPSKISAFDSEHQTAMIVYPKRLLLITCGCILSSFHPQLDCNLPQDKHYVIVLCPSTLHNELFMFVSNKAHSQHIVFGYGCLIQRWIIA